MGSGASRNGLKVDVKSNALQVAAWTREMAASQDEIMTTATAAVALAGVRQASLNGVIRGSETPSGKGPYYMVPPPGADIPAAIPKAFDFANRKDAIQYQRDPEGHILGRSFKSGLGTRYYSSDKIVSRSGHALSGLSFEQDPNTLPLAPEHHFESDMGTLEISSMAGQTLITAANTSDGQKLATLEKKGAQNGAKQPRYFLRRALKSVSGRWSTAAAKALGLAKARAKSRSGL